MNSDGANKENLHAADLTLVTTKSDKGNDQVRTEQDKATILTYKRHIDQMREYL